MKQIRRRTLKRAEGSYNGGSYNVVDQVKGGVVPSSGKVQFSAYKAPGKGFYARVSDGTRQWAGEVNRVLKTGSLSRPKIVLEDRAESKLDRER